MAQLVPVHNSLDMTIALAILVGRAILAKYITMKKIKQFLKTVWFWCKVALPIVGLTLWFGVMPFRSSTVSAEVPQVKTIDLTPQKLEAMKVDVVKRLTDCENSHYTEDDAIVIYDNNAAGSLQGKDVWSYGELQWKLGTILDEVKARDGITITAKEAKLLAFDTPKAQSLAKFTIFVNKGKGIEHWYNCANNPKFFPDGGAAEVKWIKKLEGTI